MNRQKKIAVVGGGIMGLATCLGLKNSPYQITLIAPDTPVNSSKSWVHALNSQSLDWLQAQGIDHFQCTPVHHMSVYTNADLPPWYFSSHQSPNKNLCAITHVASLIKALKVHTQGHIHHISATVNWQKTELPSLSLSNGKTFHPDLIIFADGSQSPSLVRSTINTHHQPYHQIALTASLASNQPHGNHAKQWTDQGGFLALLPTAQPSSYAMVWSMAYDQANQINDSGHLAESLKRVTKQNFMIEEPINRLPLAGHLAEQFFSKQMVWVGDAVHRIHPLAGQGANLGLYDVQILTEQLIKHASLQAALPIYQRLAKTRATFWYQWINHYWTLQQHNLQKSAFDYLASNTLTAFNAQCIKAASGYWPS
ncbi:FAD-dependent monooxygenase [Gammaproteobacteria bacterium]|nr:FAD-dependent monooxygenase [Gammaproteobacteria bacterium]